MTRLARTASLTPCAPTLLPPARLLAEVDPEHRLADDLVDQERAGRMESTASSIAIETLELVRLEHAGAAGDGHREIDDLLGGLDRVVLRGHQLHRPRHAVVDAAGPL